ncbi:NAD(P)/FAD-dependent oxidoreductase [Mumia zhuanghuii]|uniref:FAD-dependent oxidoreductase n=2 Tax=Mumia TaxID=1546255 RepID=A0ABW1QM58_9ACTN|nr:MULTISPECIES: bifunctional NAD(P)/FAD-dependent oxidoreductase/class I SAM-dependent methyltransferase [Mumia]KAA1419870.1 NAD(P)/FAD-dependent oxidoreductase [Mumia zhuanghuii]
MLEELEDTCDVAVLGGGAAGLNGALMLARARRSVVVIDAGAPRNAPAHAVHGLLGREGTPPAELLARGREEVRQYGGHVVSGTVTSVGRDEAGFTVVLGDGRAVSARRILVATGLVDELPDVEGLRERWGRDVVHCPYCHGWEVRDHAIGVLATGPLAVHQALMFRQWSDDVVLFTHTGPALAEEQAEQLSARGIPVVSGTVAGLEVADDRLTGVRMDDGRVVPRAALAVGARMTARTDFLADLGLRRQEHVSGAGEHLVVDAAGRTEVPGVWVAGNATDLSAQVGAAAAAGALAGAHINADLIDEETREAVAAYRATTRNASSTTEAYDPEFWETRYRAHGATGTVAPNTPLVETATGLAPGTALDAGSGHGSDAIWLAAQGWTVTALDVAPTALRRAGERALDVGDDVAARITWSEADLTRWTTAERYDLVTSHYVHVEAPYDELVSRLADAVAPGGTLLVVGHDTTHPSHHGVDPREAAAVLDPAEWEVLVAEVRERAATDQHGHAADLRDAVLRARRRG